MIKSHYMIDGKELHIKEIGLALYHIAHQTEVSREYTLKFVTDILCAAAESLYSDLWAEGSGDYLLEDQKGVESLKKVFDDNKSYRGDKEWLTSYNKPRVCFYHSTEHNAHELPHECPAEAGKMCFCCSEGIAYCKRTHVDAGYINNPHKEGKY